MGESFAFSAPAEPGAKGDGSTAAEENGQVFTQEVTEEIGGDQIDVAVPVDVRGHHVEGAVQDALATEDHGSYNFV